MKLKSVIKVMEVNNGYLIPHFEGSAMFGKTCVAIAGTNLDLLYSTARKFKLPKPHWDTIVKTDYVIYWPNISYDSLIQ